MGALPRRRLPNLRAESDDSAAEHDSSQAFDDGRLVRGTYRSPILVQWRPAEDQTRRGEITISELR